MALNNFGHLRQEQKDMDAALDLFERSVRMREKAFPGGHEMVVNPMAGLAMLSVGAGRKESALAWATKASGMATRVYDRPEHGAAFAHWVLALVRMRNDDYPGAAEALQLSEAVFLQISPPPEDLAETIPALRERICADPRAAGAPACAPR